MLYRFKASFQKTVRWIAGSGLTANGATLGGWVCVALYAVSLYGGLVCDSSRWLLFLVPVWALVRLMMNALDGMLARAQGTATAAGELWNEASDIWGDTLSYGVLFLVPDGPRISLAVFLVLSWSAEFFGVLGKSLPGGARRQESWGGGKPERAIWMSLLALALCWDPTLLAKVPAVLSGISVLVGLTSIARIRKSLKLAEGKPYQSFTAFGV